MYWLNPMETRTSNVSSAPTVDQPAQVLLPGANKDDMEPHPWEPLVLSLDGGGVRGLSSLYILRRIMLRIRELEAGVDGHTTVSEDDLRLPLPCHYFDNIIGVSTGGYVCCDKTNLPKSPCFRKQKNYTQDPASTRLDIRSCCP